MLNPILKKMAVQYLSLSASILRDLRTISSTQKKYYVIIFGLHGLEWYNVN